MSICVEVTPQRCCHCHFAQYRLLAVIDGALGQ